MMMNSPAKSMKNPKEGNRTETGDASGDRIRLMKNPSIETIRHRIYLSSLKLVVKEALKSENRQ